MQSPDRGPSKDGPSAKRPDSQGVEPDWNLYGAVFKKASETDGKLSIDYKLSEMDRSDCAFAKDNATTRLRLIFQSSHVAGAEMAIWLATVDVPKQGTAWAFGPGSKDQLIDFKTTETGGAPRDWRSDIGGGSGFICALEVSHDKADASGSTKVDGQLKCTLQDVASSAAAPRMLTLEVDIGCAIGTGLATGSPSGTGSGIDTGSGSPGQGSGSVPGDGSGSAPGDGSASGSGS